MGFGRVHSDYDWTGGAVFVVTLKERGVWELSQGDAPLLTVRDGVGRLPRRSLDTTLFRETVSRLVSGANLDQLTHVAEAAEHNDHGAMLIISNDAPAEAERLAPQAWSTVPRVLSSAMLEQLTSMDGSILVDGQGRCHAIGVILDGLAQGVGDPSRGSRFNNAVRYLGNNPPRAVIVTYSADGSINILPELIPLVKRSAVQKAVDDFVAAVADENVGYEVLFDLWEAAEKLGFYLSADQCEALNDARRTFESEKDYQRLRVQFHRNDLAPDIRMNESYWLP